MVNEGRFPENLPPVWKKLLGPEEEKPYFQSLTTFLKKEYGSGKSIFPDRKHVLRALRSVDYPDVRVVILGQDPYPGVGHAVGLSFAVPNELKVKPPSLVNIFKEIHSDLGKQIDRGKSELTSWANQGVLLLNTVLTVRKGTPFSHRGQGWEAFTDRIISLLSEREDPLVFLLWGNPARKKKELIHERHTIIESAHPSPLSAHAGFFGSRPFSKCNQRLLNAGLSPIQWELTH